MVKDKNREPEPVAGSDGEDGPDKEYEVESIVGHKFDPEDEERVRYLYRIRWVDYTEADDTWEPKESLEGGAEGILSDYIEARKNEGDVFFKEGYRKSKVQQYLEKTGIDASRLEWDAHNEDGTKKKKKRSSTSTKQSNSKSRKEDVAGNTSASAATAESSIQAEKAKKRKQRASIAAAEEAEPERGEKSSRRASSSQQHQGKKTRREVSDSPLPPPLSKTSTPISNNNKHDRSEKESDSQLSKKPSSKRSTTNSVDQQASERKSSSSAQQPQQQQDSEDETAAAKEMEQIKRSPLKEKEADQRKSEEPPTATPGDKPTSANNESGKAPLESNTPDKSKATAQDKQGGEEKDEFEGDLPLGSVINAKLPSWEDLVIVESLEQDMSTPNQEYKWFIRWNRSATSNSGSDGAPRADDYAPEEWIPNSLARKKFPQALLDFYEDHLKFKSNTEVDDDYGNGEDNNNLDGGAVNGDATMDRD